MPRKLLLADSSITIQKVVELSLSDEGFQVTSARDGDAALKLAAEIKPDIVLADIFLPSIDGYDLCKRMKADPNLKDIPVILLVGKSEFFDMNKANLSGAADFINKPFESSELIEKVKSYAESNEAYEVVELTEEEGIDIKPVKKSPVSAAMPSMTEEDIMPIKEVAEPQIEKGLSEEMELVSFENLDKARELEDTIIPKTPLIEPKDEKAEENIPFYDITELEEPAEAKIAAKIVSKEDLDAAIKGIVSPDELRQRLASVLQSSVSELLKTISANELRGQIVSAVQKYGKEIASGISKDEIMAEMNRILNQMVRERVGGVSSQEMKEEQIRVIREAAKDAVKSISPDAVMKELKKGIDEEGKKILESISSSDAVKVIVRENIQRFVPSDIKNDILPIIEQEAKRLVQGVSIDEIRSEIEKSTARIFEEKIEGMILNISKDIIEKITWEIVPSLAEVIINREIEKITAEGG
ncbi:MAG: response regulator [Nitrospirae bacterium]|nr:response regulator [Nitrospirota bacterium]